MKNLMKYVADVFKTLPWLDELTDTAGALERVRTEDLDLTRGNTTIVMVFTDGVSNSEPETLSEAKLLKPLVEKVYAFGIGSGRDPE